jgi:hypothetical protein
MTNKQLEDALAAVRLELSTQFTRIAQMQAQLDRVAANARPGAVERRRNGHEAAVVPAGAPFRRDDA